MRLELGKFYVTRENEVVGPMQSNQGWGRVDYPFEVQLCGGRRRTYTSGGVWEISGESERDIVREYLRWNLNPPHTIELVSHVKPTPRGRTVHENGDNSFASMLRGLLLDPRTSIFAIWTGCSPEIGSQTYWQGEWWEYSTRGWVPVEQLRI